jgi:riboflavin kinase
MRPQAVNGGPILPEDKEILKQLARQGALHEFVPISSGELATHIGTSQQTASRKILELLDRGLIARRMGTRKQLIRIAPSGLGTLRQEYAEYVALFQAGERVTIRGKVVSGLGEGGYYISREGYRRQFQALLGFDPYPGTLNVEVEPADREKLPELREVPGIQVNEFEDEGRTFGGVKCFKAEIQLAGHGSRPCAAILPVRSHYATVLELIAPLRLRDALGLVDGSEITVLIRTETDVSRTRA